MESALGLAHTRYPFSIQGLASISMLNRANKHEIDTAIEFKSWRQTLSSAQKLLKSIAVHAHVNIGVFPWDLGDLFPEELGAVMPSFSALVLRGCALDGNKFSLETRKVLLRTKKLPLLLAKRMIVLDTASNGSVCTRNGEHLGPLCLRLVLGKHGIKALQWGVLTLDKAQRGDLCARDGNRISSATLQLLLSEVGLAALQAGVITLERARLGELCDSSGSRIAFHDLQGRLSSRQLTTTFTVGMSQHGPGGAKTDCQPVSETHLADHCTQRER